jgi:hypothetical protein
MMLYLTEIYDDFYHGENPYARENDGHKLQVADCPFHR